MVLLRLFFEKRLTDSVHLLKRKLELCATEQDLQPDYRCWIIAYLPLSCLLLYPIEKRLVNSLAEQAEKEQREK